MAKVKIGSYYKNLPTGRICKVTGKCFFNIKYDDLRDVYSLNPQYCHYKTFQKYWAEVPKPSED